MVNPGHPSRGCLACRASKAKCDEGQPTCGRCIKRRRTCIYRDNAFRDMNSWSERTVQCRVASKLLLQRGEASPSVQHLGTRDSSTTSTPEPLIPIDWLNESIGPFFNRFVVQPDTLESTWGFMTFAPLYYASPTRTMHLVDALNACAMGYMANVSGVQRLEVLASQAYGVALEGFSLAIQDPKAAWSDESLTTMMLLALYEVISGIKASQRHLFHGHSAGQTAAIRLRQPQPQHHNVDHSIVGHSNRHLLWGHLGSRTRPSPSQRKWYPNTYRSWLDEQSVQITILIADVCASVRELQDVSAYGEAAVPEEELATCIEDALTVERAIDVCYRVAPKQWQPKIDPIPPSLRPAIRKDVSNKSLSNLECVLVDFELSPSPSRPKDFNNNIDDLKTPYEPRKDTYASQPIVLLWNNIRSAHLHHLRAMIDLRQLETKATAHLYTCFPTIEELRMKLSDVIHDTCSSAAYILGDVSGDTAQDTPSDEANYTIKSSLSSSRQCDVKCMSPGHLGGLLYTLHKVCCVPGLASEVKTWVLEMFERIGTKGHMRSGLHLKRLYSQERPSLCT